MLSQIDRYISRQVLVSTLFAVLILSLVLVLGNVFKEIREMLVDKGAPISILGRFVLLVLPFSFMYTIPWGFLAAVLLVFGRLSADQELVGFRGAGQSLFRIALPVIVLGFIFTGVCFYLNGSLGPRSKNEQKELLYEVLKDDPLKLLDPGVVQSGLKGQKIYIEERDGGVLKGFHAYQLSGDEHDTEPVGYVYAESVELIHKGEQQLSLRLKNAYGEPKGGESTQFLYTEDAEPWLADFSKDRKRVRKPNAIENGELVEMLLDEGGEITDERRGDLQFELSRRFSFSLAPLALGFVAIPLGMGSRRRETSSGLLMSVIVGFVYFLFLIAADEMKRDGEVLPLVLLWLPNVLCLLLGMFWLHRASRKS